MLKSRRVGLLLIIVLVLTCVLAAPVTAAKEIRVSSVTGVPLNATGIINVSIVDPVSVNAFTLNFTYSSDVMNITRRTNDVPGWPTLFVTQTRGFYLISGWPTPGSEINANTILFDFTCEALRNDGKSSFVNVTIISIEESDVEKKTEYAAINGTFTPIDTQPPVITITAPTSSTVPQTVNVTATITDWGGIAEGSWVVTVNDVNAPIINFAQITNGYQINASRTGVPLGSAFINVSAQDLSSNTGRASKTVTVASQGFTFDPVLNGFTNQSQPVVNAVFNFVNSNTVRMFMGSSPSTYVNVTDKCDILGSATDGSIALNYTKYGAMADGIYWVKVNGTSSLGGPEESATESFTKDTTPPVITITSIADSDGDGYAEAGELLTISYNLIDSNPANVWIGSEINTTGLSNGKLFYTPAKGNLVGNINTTIHARDMANLESQSSSFHIYNNYLAYITDPSLGTLVGLNLSLTSVYDIFNVTAKAISISGANDAMRAPQLGKFEKTITGGSKVVVDNRADQSIAAGALPQEMKIYAPPGAGTFDYTITVPYVTNATMILVRANSTMLNESITTRSFSQSNLKNLIDMNLIGIYSNSGVALVSIDAGGGFTDIWGYGPVSLVNNNLPQTIRDNSVDLSAGYSTAARGLSFEVGTNLTKGEYILAAVCMDNDRLGIIAQMPFAVTAQPKTILSANRTAYPTGVPVKVTSTMTGDYIGAALFMNDVVYPGNMTVDFASVGPGSLKEMNLFADGNRSVMEKLISKIYVTKGYGVFAKVQNSNTVEVPTNDLLLGNYTVYMFLENGGNLTAFNQVNVTIGGVVPDAEFSGTPTSGTAPLTVNFTDLSTGAPTSWNWTFGDGSLVNATMKNPVHTYANPGNYTVSLNATNALGSNTETKVDYITVTAAPVVAATITVNVFNAAGAPFNADSISFYNGSGWNAPVVYGANTATYPGLVSGTAYQVMVYRIGFLNVSGSVSAVAGQNRMVNVTLAQLGELITPRVVLSENGTAAIPVSMNTIRASAIQQEILNYTVQITGNDSAVIAIEYPYRMIVNSTRVTLNGLDIPGTVVPGTWSLNISDSLKPYTTTNTTIFIPVPAGSGGKFVNVSKLGGKLGDANNDMAINVIDKSQVVGIIYSRVSMPAGYDYADTNRDGNINIFDKNKLVGRLYSRVNEYYL